MLTSNDEPKMGPQVTKMTVFEKQLSLINSSSVGMKSSHYAKRKQPTIGYYSHSSAFSGNSIGSGDSTLIGSPVGLANLNSGIYKYNIHMKPHVIKRKNSIHLRIPLFYLTEGFRVVRKIVKNVYSYATSFNREQIQLVLDILSILVIGTTSSFASELLHYNKKVFISSFPVTGICLFNFSNNKNSLIFATDFVQKVTIMDPKITIQILITCQLLVLCSLVKVALVFKFGYMDEDHLFGLDQLVLLMLVLIITALSTNMILNSIPEYFQISLKSTEEGTKEERTIEKQAQNCTETIVSES